MKVDLEFCRNGGHGFTPDLDGSGGFRGDLENRFGKFFSGGQELDVLVAYFSTGITDLVGQVGSDLTQVSQLSEGGGGGSQRVDGRARRETRFGEAIDRCGWRWCTQQDRGWRIDEWIGKLALGG